MGVDYRKVRPKKGNIVRYPRTYAVLPDVGASVPWIGPDGRYWRRRLNTGDIEIVTEDTSPTVKDAKVYNVKKIKNGEEEK